MSDDIIRECEGTGRGDSASERATILPASMRASEIKGQGGDRRAETICLSSIANTIASMRICEEAEGRKGDNKPRVGKSNSERK